MQKVYAVYNLCQVNVAFLYKGLFLKLFCSSESVKFIVLFPGLREDSHLLF